MHNRLKLLFVSPRFLFPANTGGQIRTSQILRGMKRGVFDITLVSPAPKNFHRYKDELDSVSDRFVCWQDQIRGPVFKLSRLRHLKSSVPISVASDKSVRGSQIVAAELAKKPDVVVFDFPHSAVLAPQKLQVPSVMFTHNVEAEIFERHLKLANNPLLKTLWRDQLSKMVQFERDSLNKFDKIVAVSNRDKKMFETDYQVQNISVIRTGVDLDFFQYTAPQDEARVIFIGSMDWLANIDAMEYFMQEVWPLITAQVPQASMTVIGRNPPSHLVQMAKSKGLKWTFTGLVDDVREHARKASVSVIPMRVGGGTRIKAFESMAIGSPVVSTTIGVEGLPLNNEAHFLRADSASEFANAVTLLLQDKDRREKLSRQARRYVEDNFSFALAADEFQDICLQVSHKKNAVRSYEDSATDLEIA